MRSIRTRAVLQVLFLLLLAFSLFYGRYIQPQRSTQAAASGSTVK